MTDGDGARTAVDLLRATALRHGDRDAYVEPGRRFTFAEWDRAADGLAAQFAEAGVTAGDVVALILPSSIDYAVCYQAAMRLRAITTGINPRLGPAEVTSILDRTAPRVVVREQDLDGVRAAYTRRSARRAPDATTRRSRRDRVDERHDRSAQGRGVRSRKPGRGRARRGRDG